MALGEQRKTVRKKQTITQVSWSDGVSLDPYYWLERSFQYARNVNCDDELHWLKLSQKAEYVEYYAKSQLVSVWNRWIVALPVWNETDDVRVFNTWSSGEDWEDGWKVIGSARWWNNSCPWVLFQDKTFWAFPGSDFRGLFYREEE